ncbi:unnamed protein product [Brassica oleracea]
MGVKLTFPENLLLIEKIVLTAEEVEDNEVVYWRRVSQHGAEERLQ